MITGFVSARDGTPFLVLCLATELFMFLLMCPLGACDDQFISDTMTGMLPRMFHPPEDSV